MSRPANPVAAARAAGEETERHVSRAIPALGLVPDEVAEHYDAIATTALFPSERLPMVGICVVARGTRVEIKSSVRRLTSGQRGRFYVRREQHERLVEAGGVYVFTVVDDDRRPIALKVVPATVVSEVVPGWRSGGDGRGDCAQVAWSNVLAPAEVEERGRT